MIQIPVTLSERPAACWTNDTPSRYTARGSGLWRPWAAAASTAGCCLYAGTSRTDSGPSVSSSQLVIRSSCRSSCSRESQSLRTGTVHTVRAAPNPFRWTGTSM
eukprot:8659749-Pyramimonas_sp.AAC.1